MFKRRARPGVAEALSDLLRTPCRCEPDWTERGRHAPDCEYAFIRLYLDDADIELLLWVLN